MFEVVVFCLFSIDCVFERGGEMKIFDWNWWFIGCFELSGVGLFLLWLLLRKGFVFYWGFFS
jgi:hypothetical protein